jgi:hypothetical protein
MTLDEAEALRERLIGEVYPELKLYLAEDGMAQLAAQLGVSEDEAWMALSDDGDRPEWLPQYLRNILQGRTCRRDGTPYNEKFRQRAWEGLIRLNRHPELADELAQQAGSEDLAKKMFGQRPVATLTGRLRADVSFTQARNTPFQGLAADGAKLALFHLVRAGYRVVAFIHDEFLIELPIDADLAAAAQRIIGVMCEAMQGLTGNVPIACGEPVVMERWSKEAEVLHNTDGKLKGWATNSCETPGSTTRGGSR